jgi:hypothetical protein
MMNWETEGFFRIGMHHRHERNAIIQHGTMTLVRAADLRRLRWNEDCMCEDTELGLRLLQAGHRAVYVDRQLGAGLLPRRLFEAYARQRKRWAQGAMQILKQHAGSLLGRSRSDAGPALPLPRRLAALAGRHAAFPVLGHRDRVQPGHGLPADQRRTAAVAVRPCR